MGALTRIVWEIKGNERSVRSEFFPILSQCLEARDKYCIDHCMTLIEIFVYYGKYEDDKITPDMWQLF